MFYILVSLKLQPPIEVHAFYGTQMQTRNVSTRPQILFILKGHPILRPY